MSEAFERRSREVGLGVDLDGRVASDIEFRVRSTSGKSGGWNIQNSRSAESRRRSRLLVAKGGCGPLIYFWLES